MYQNQHMELRQLRGLTIAKMYLRLNEFAHAEQYGLSYLQANEDSDQVHKLLGQCSMGLKQPEKALQYFQRSLHLNSKQPDVIIDVCKILQDDKYFNPKKALYWCGLADSEKVNDEAVFKLRLKLIQDGSLTSDQLEEKLQKEIIADPSNILTRIRLLQYYLDQKKIFDAFKYVLNYEMKHHFEICQNIGWYNMVSIVLSKYEALPNAKKDFDYWVLLIMCFERQVQLSFNGGGNTTNLLFSLDQHLYQLSQIHAKINGQRELSEYLLNHYRGQLLLHCATLIFQREISQNKNRWKETTIMVLPLLFLGYQLTKIRKEPWMLHCDEQGKMLVQLWKRETAFRCIQTARTILSCVDDTVNNENANNMSKYMGYKHLWTSNNDLLNQVRSTCNDKNWRRKVFALLFCSPEQKVKEETSLLVKCSALQEPYYEMPEYVDIERYEEIAALLKPSSLAHMVYLCLGAENLSSVRAKYFNGLSFSIANLAACGAETVNQLDIESFMYAATIQAKRLLEIQKETQESYYSSVEEIHSKPGMLLYPNIENLLCTEEQSKWWIDAYNKYKNIQPENVMESRENLRYGIEAVRGLNGPKMDMLIMFKLGKIFVNRSQDMVKPVEKTQLEARVEAIYKSGLNMFKLNNKGILEPFKRLFKYAQSNSSAYEKENAAAAEEAISFLAARFFKKADYEDLIEELNGLQLPFASYLQAEAYRKLEELSKTPKATKRLFGEKASECLSQTLEYLKNPIVDPNHILHSIIHGDIRKNQMNLRNNSTDYYSPTNGSAHHSSLHNNSSTYEDAEEGIFEENLRTPNLTLNRSRRDSNIAAVLQTSIANNAEVENLIKQMSNTLILVKDEILNNVKPELTSISKEVVSLKDKLSEVEELLKKSRISSSSPSRDDVSNALDLYAIDDALQNHLYGQTNNMYSNLANGPAGMGLVNSPFGNQQLAQPSRLMTPNALQMNAPFNGSLFNQNYPMLYNPQFPMGTSAMPNQGAMPLNTNAMGQNQLGGLAFNGVNPAAAASNLMQPSLLAGSRGLPLMDSTGNFNFDMSTNSANNPYNMPISTMSTTKEGISFSTSMTFTTSGTSLTSTTIVSTSSTILNTTASVSSSGVTFNKALNNQPVEKGPPANVVITSSDPLPNPNIIAQQQTQQPALSVTIPSHHIKQSLVTQTNDLPSSLIGSTPVSTASTFGSQIAASAGSSSVPLFGGLSTKSPGYFTVPSAKDTVTDTINAVASDTSGKDSTTAATTLFSKPAKSTEDTQSNKSVITPKAPTKSEAISDNKPQSIFNVSKNITPSFTSTPASKSESSSSKTTTSNVIVSTSSTNITAAKPLFGNLTPKTTVDQTKTNTSTTTTASPFQGFSFGSTTATTTPDTKNLFANIAKSSPSLLPAAANKDIMSPNFFKMPQQNNAATPEKKELASVKSGNEETEDEYVPTAEFKPVIPLPDLVDTSTGEENEIVLFEHRAKLLRFDKTTNEWKERGLGNIKVLQDKNDVNKVRLVMRREQIHKLCCNQRLYKTTVFKYAKNSETALTWAGPDYSENELVTETLTIRFKTPEICKRFHEAILAAQNKMTDDNEQSQSETSKKSTSVADKKEAPAQGFGDKFKPKAGSWSCDGCYTSNDASKQYCVACDAPKDETVPKKEAAPAANLFAPSGKSTFSFGFPATTTGPALNATASPLLPTPNQSLFGTNTAKPTPTVATKDQNKDKPINNKDDGAGATVKGFGDKFKPKAGSWNCKDCYLSNPGDVVYCNACNCPKDDTVPKKEPETKNLLALSNPKEKFSFGFSANTNAATAKPADLSTFSFGLPSAVKSESAAATTKPSAGGGSFDNLASANASKSFSTSATTTTLGGAASGKSIGKDTFTFKLHSTAMDKPAPGGTFNFSLNANNLMKNQETKTTDEHNDESHEEEEEENNTYFAPVIPLPDKIEVITGEESEELLYVHRAKLYRYVNHEWKERGLGNVKILRHKETKKLRVVMRREQVLKICLNHALNESVEYKPKDEKSWLFVVNDFSEGNVELQRFSLRFKTKEIAGNFMTAIKEALEGTAKAIEDAADNLLNTSNKLNSSSEVSSTVAKSSTKANGQANETVTKQPVIKSDSTTVKGKPKAKEDLKESGKDSSKETNKDNSKGLTKEKSQAKTKHVENAKNKVEVRLDPKAAAELKNILKEEDNPLPLVMPKLTGIKSNKKFTLKKSSLLVNTPTEKEATVAADGPAKTQKSPIDFTAKKDVNTSSSTTSLTPAADKSINASNFSFATALHSTTTSDKTIEEGGSIMAQKFDTTKFGTNPIFGSFAGKSIFGGGASATVTAASTIAPASNTAPENDKDKVATTSIFGAPPSIFGGAPKPSANIFGGDANKPIIFPSGGSIFGNAPAPNFESKSIFGKATFNNATPVASTTNIFGSAAVANSTTGGQFSLGDLTNKDTPGDFALLSSKAAALEKDKTAISNPFSKQSMYNTNFVGLTNITDSFSGIQNNSLTKNKSLTEDKDGGDEENGDENHDPHFEPIIALPKEIVVTTGEEEETKLFGERATLYRYDTTNKEWKERGVGELKILYHPKLQKHRLVMRREQVHLLVLNQSVTPEFTFSNHRNNPKSFTWCALNFAESEEGVAESLAVRFKKEQIAEMFKSVLDKCIDEAKKQKA